jgi:hypothetical protein
VSAAPIRFFLDENLPIVVADQLQRRGIDAVTVRDLNLLGQSDIDHLELARQTGRVLCTHDADYLELAQSGEAHSGLIFGQQEKHGVGSWVGFLELVYNVYTAEEMVGRIEYL